MKYLNLFLLSAVVFTFFQCNNKKISPPEIRETVVNAPFEMEAIKTPNFEACPKFSIIEFGAEAGNKDKNIQAIKMAIEKANAAGGGTVIIPKGEWITGAIHFKSNVNLHLNKGAVLVFSGNPEDYLPPVRSSWEGFECYNYSPLIYAYQCKNIALTGEGRIEAQMEVWQKWFARPKAHMENLKRLYFMASNDTILEERQMVNDSAHFRPQFIQFNRSENILLDGISIRHSPFWTIHLFLSHDIVVRNLNVFAHGHNNDGIDPEMSQNILIENCVFDQGDDAIAVKSGRNQDAWRLHTPSKNIVIKNCTVINGHQLVAVGSELSGGIENIFIDSCRVADGAKLFHLLFIKTNERRGGFVKNIYMRNVTAGRIDMGILGIETDVLYQWRDLVPTLERRLTPIENIYLENVKAKNVKFISRILAQSELPVKDVQLSNVTADTVQNQKYINENVLNFKTE